MLRRNRSFAFFMAKGEGGGGTKGTKGTKGDVTFFGEESNKEPVCDVKVKLIKLEGGTAAPPPVAGKTLCCLVWSKLRPVIPSLFPFGRATHALRPAALSAATGAWLDAENRRGGWQ